MEHKLKNLKYSFRCLGVLIKQHPWFLIGQIISLVCLIVQTLVPINVVGAITSAFEQGSEHYEIMVVVVKNILVLVAVNIVSLIVDFLMNFINAHFTLSFSTVLFRKLDSIDYDFHENPKFLDNYTRALDNGAEKIYNVAFNQMRIIKIFFQVIAVFSVIISVGSLAIIFVVITSILYSLSRRASGVLGYKRMTEERPFVRKRWYIARTYFVKDSIPDLKMTDINDVLLQEHSNSLDGVLKVFRKFTVKKTIYDTIGSILLALIFPFLIGVVCYVILNPTGLQWFLKPLSGITPSPSQLTAMTVAATTISNLVTTFTNTITDIQIDALETRIPFEVLDMKSSIEGMGGKPISSEFESLEVKDVSFAYIETKVLKDINFKIKKGEKIAIVGFNGAGKTTLVKLLLRLYDPLEGDLYINGMNYKETDPASLRKAVGAVFQNTEVYSVTIAENILLKKIETKEEEELVIKALKFADIYDYVLTLPDGINTMVTREFRREGAIFSGGQKQKIAVARGYAQNYDLFILDEPSSALDPIAEATMYHNMLELGTDKTLIFISHRLSATANVDRIYLFEGGRIVESGTHSELINLESGRYKEMFNSQAEKYIGGIHD